MNKAKQQGVALLTILIMVVLATILAMSILKAQQATLDETKLLLRQNQALMYAQSAEYFFSELLVQDAKDNSIDHRSESWAQPFPMLPIEDGFVSGQIYDQQSKFNLNTLLNEDGSRHEAAIEFFQALLQRLDLDPNLVEAVIDWQDADQDTVGAMGAENAYYQGMKDSLLAPNMPFSSVEQLNWVRGFKGLAYQKIRPYVTALPSRTTKMNINSIDGFLLSVLQQNANVVMLQSELDKKLKNLEYFNEVAELWSLESLANVPTERREKFSNLFSTQSQYFNAEISVQLSQRQRHMTTAFYRSGQVVQSYQRSWLLQSQQF